MSGELWKEFCDSMLLILINISLVGINKSEKIIDI